MHDVVFNGKWVPSMDRVMSGSSNDRTSAEISTSPKNICTLLLFRSDMVASLLFDLIIQEIAEGHMGPSLRVNVDLWMPQRWGVFIYCLVRVMVY